MGRWKEGGGRWLQCDMQENQVGQDNFEKCHSVNLQLPVFLSSYPMGRQE